MIEITEVEYESLKQDARKLLELECLGVDNWSGYDDIDWTYIKTGIREEQE